MIQGLKFTVITVCVLAAFNCAAGTKTQTVSRVDFAEAWPFTVDSVDLTCEGPSPKALARTDDGTVYALNGSARSAAKSRGWADGRDITKPSPTMPSVKMDYSNIVQIAQELCQGS
ncbi:DUF2511 domain-containing protein [Pseudomonas fluorescens]|uniref:DUF2511 domain-containing protein n=2 Tax=Pseudomonas fluorescens TaxID=294 RepID=A0AAE2U2S1_PSEFL|nr:DUF2511 domain-containing protein [Pseudomonas fluorescens]